VEEEKRVKIENKREITTFLRRKAKRINKKAIIAFLISVFPIIS